MNKEIITVNQISNSKKDIEGGKMSKDFLAREKNEKEAAERERIERGFENRRDQAILEKKAEVLQGKKDKKKILQETQENLKKLTLENKISEAENELRALNERAEREVKIKDSARGFENSDELKNEITEKMPDGIRADKKSYMEDYAEGRPTEYEGFGYWDKTKKPLSELIKEKEIEIKKLRGETEPEPAKPEPVTPEPAPIPKPEKPKEKQKMITYDRKKEITWDGTGRKQITHEPKESKKAYMVDMSEVVKAYARREAETKLAEMKETAGFMKRTFIRLGEKGYLVKFYKEALLAIENNSNLMAEIEARVLRKSKDKSENREKSFDVLDDVIDGYMQNIEEADERGELVNDPNVNLEISQIFSDFATSGMTREEFEKQIQERVAPMLSGKQFSGEAGRAGEAEGLLYASNLFKLAEGYKRELEVKIAEYGPDQKENAIKAMKGEFTLDIQLGLKQKDLNETKPEPVLKWYEKFIDCTQNIPVLNKIIANPVAYGIVGGVIGSQIGKSAGRAALVAGLATIAGVAPWAIPLIAGGALGGAYAGMRRSRDLQYDRGMDLRRKTLGAESGGKRTDKMREFNYDQKQAEDITADLQGLLSNSAIGENGKKLVAEVIARMTVGKEQKVDLISVKEKTGDEHKTNLIAMNQMKIALRDVREKFNLGNADVEEYLRQYKEQFTQNIADNDKAFGKFKTKESVKAGIFGAAMGLAAGALGQHAFIKGKELITGDDSKTESALSHLYAYTFGEKHFVPNDSINIVPNGDHFSIQDGDRVLVENAQMGTNGLDQASKTALESQGIKLNEISGQTESVMDKLKGIFGEKMGVHQRGPWHDNAGSEYSEVLKRMVQFEGKQQMFYLDKDPNGAVTVDASKILKNLADNIQGNTGSFGENPDSTIDSKLPDLLEKLQQWHANGELAKHLEVVIIPTDQANKEGTSILLDAVTPDGKIKLPDSLSEMFSDPQSLKEGHLPFKFMELRLDGHVLSTTSGEGLQDTIIPPTYSFETEKLWDVPPVVPVYPRLDLEGRGKKGEEDPKKKGGDDKKASSAAQLEAKKIDELRKKIKSAEPSPEAQRIDAILGGGKAVEAQQKENNPGGNGKERVSMRKKIFERAKGIFSRKRRAEAQINQPIQEKVELAEKISEPVEKNNAEELKEFNKEVTWEYNKGDFITKDSLKEIMGIPVEKGSVFERLINDVKRIEEMRAGRISLDQNEMNVWNRRFDDYKRKNSDITFDEFIFCCRRGLETLEKVSPSTVFGSTNANARRPRSAENQNIRV
ncbi:MAG: hypothetical protein WCX17_03225 [Parcubacteria group bacterium]|jgi:hypothetical protein